MQFLLPRQVLKTLQSVAFSNFVFQDTLIAALMPLEVAGAPEKK